MKLILKLTTAAVLLTAVLASCKKTNDAPNGTANTAIAASSNLVLNNRVLAAFVIDSSSIRNLPSGILPSVYNKFRKQLTYDTVAAANKPPVYSVGDIITIAGYVKGDDNAISRRSLTFRFFQPPSTFIRPADLFPVQRAEDSIRNFAPRAADVLDAVSQAAIAVNTNAPFTVSQAGSESVFGVNYNTYLVVLNYTIPASLAGKLVSVNFTVNTGLRNDLGNVNWNYAFRVR